MEIWKDIKNYEGLYEISSYGRVRAKYRQFVGKDGKVKKYSEKMLKADLSIIKRGYVRITLSKDYVAKRFQVHRLVAEHFISNPENKPFVNHIDNNGLNNHIENLEWCTHSENMLHAQKQGRLFSSQSKGGSIGGQINTQKSLANANKLIGTQKGKWLVKGISPIKKNHKTSLELICTGCKRQFVYTMEYFNNSIGTACPRCKAR